MRGDFATAFRGFRHIVAIGDSQTYGMAVRREQAWPQQIETLSGRTVYNMSFGGYGLVEGLALLEEATITAHYCHLCDVFRK